MADKFAIITGASTGIGFELATLAAKDGYDLLVVADEPLIDAAAADFQQFGTDVQSVEADLVDDRGRRSAARRGGRPPGSTCSAPMPAAASATPSSTRTSPTGGT